MRYLNILSHIASTPLALHPAKGEALVRFLLAKAFGDHVTPEVGQRRTHDYGYVMAAHDGRLDRMTAEGLTARMGEGQQSGKAVAVLALTGAISPRVHDVEDASSGGGVSAEGFARNLQAAADDARVGGIVIDIDSPGGSVFGVPEAAAQLRAAREVKPVVAVAAPWAASAAYWIGSAAGELAVTPSGEVGSVGVYMYHESIARYLEKRGVDPTVIKAPEHKAEGLSAFALTDETRAHWQGRVDALYQQFVADVASSRGVSTAHVVESFGGGRMLPARAAVRAGMADRIGTLDDEIRAMVARINSPASAGAGASRRARARRMALI